ncbi:hypothetical protein [Pseudovibrio ascidiaceicola]|uniref:hypothetical protein n=1 Tax=Pseudovibrio ascidiaceicola TaxID=285279 RepID=UPI0014312F14|nr:hypothetical protein [Pseudovibrio ascidiaceicola]
MKLSVKIFVYYGDFGQLEPQLLSGARFGQSDLSAVPFNAMLARKLVSETYGLFWDDQLALWPLGISH